MRSSAARDRFNTGFERLRRLVSSASVVTVVDRKWLFLGIYAGRLRAARSSCSSACRPASCRPRTRARRSVQFRLPAGATQDRTLEVQRAGRELFPARAREEERPDLFHRRRRRPGRRGPEHRPGASSTSPTWDERHGQGEQRRRDRPARVAAPSAASATRRSSRWSPARSAASASRAASPWSCRTRSGMTPRAVRRGARPAARSWPTPIRSSTSVRLSELPDVATLQGRHRTSSG